MIIDCHGHYTTEPAQLTEYRKAQLEGLEADPSFLPSRADLNISDDLSHSVGVGVIDGRHVESALGQAVVTCQRRAQVAGPDDGYQSPALDSEFSPYSITQRGNRIPHSSRALKFEIGKVSPNVGGIDPRSNCQVIRAHRLGSAIQFLEESEVARKPGDCGVGDPAHRSDDTSGLLLRSGRQCLPLPFS